MKTKEECKDESAIRTGYVSFWDVLYEFGVDFSLDSRDTMKRHVLFEIVDSAMEVYASQFNEIKMPSEEEIKNKFPCESGQSVIMEEDMAYEDVRLDNNGRRQGAKWMKYQIIKLNK